MRIWIAKKSGVSVREQLAAQIMLGVISQDLKPGEKLIITDVVTARDVPSGYRASFLHRGVFSCYRPVEPSTPITLNPTQVNPEDWARLTYYSHKYKGRAFDVYTKRYLVTSGQIYWIEARSPSVL